MARTAVSLAGRHTFKAEFWLEVILSGEFRCFLEIARVLGQEVEMQMSSFCSERGKVTGRRVVMGGHAISPRPRDLAETQGERVPWFPPSKSRSRSGKVLREESVEIRAACFLYDLSSQAGVRGPQGPAPATGWKRAFKYNFLFSPKNMSVLPHSSETLWDARPAWLSGLHVRGLRGPGCGFNPQ